MIFITYLLTYLLTYLFTDEFLVDKISLAVLWKNTCKQRGFRLNFSRRPRICYKDTRIKAYDISKLTIKLKSNKVQ